MTRRTLVAALAAISCVAASAGMRAAAPRPRSLRSPRFAAPAAAAAAADPALPTMLSAYVNTNAAGALSCVVTSGYDSDAPASLFFQDAVNTTGWGNLQVLGSFHANVTEDAVAFAMGCAEAAATWPFMNAYWSNYEANEYGAAGPSPALRNFMSAQLAWARAGVASWKQAQLAKQASLPKMKSLRALGDKFWGGMAMLLSQFDGLVYYYNTFVPAAQRLDEIDLYMLNSVGDLEDLDQQFPNKVAGARFVGATAAARAELHASTSRRPATEVRASLLRDDMPLRDKMVDCSALIRLLPDLSDVLVGHTTWRMYYAMLRVYKMYQMPFTNAGWVSFSSSPGLLHSKDDFYITPQLAVMETTNSVFNQTLFQLYLTPKSALSWQRAYIANGFATSATEWTDLFAMYNSGTYNNQWMVADYTKFTPGNKPQPNFLRIIEQIPGFTDTADVTPVLISQLNWPSYNIPYLRSIFNASGYPAMVAKYGAEYTYESNSRALIFARNVSLVTDWMSARALLRYNNYLHDPLAKGDPITGSISSRGDFRTPKPVAFGGVDTKVTSMRGSMGPDFDLRVFAESGPTHDQLPFFAWSGANGAFANVQHTLVPAEFDFDTVMFEM